ncbi:MAG: T9SS type A sorting domain-containing protein [candidate division Zixibacteria bacterium]|nr:T9SS type A sorting domain-containing protein [candidate division Zixibacteria bacterium]
MMKHKLLVTFILVLFLLSSLVLAKADKLTAVETIPAKDMDNVVIVPIQVENTQDLVAMDIPLEWSEGATLDKVVFTDRVEHMQFKYADMNNEDRQVIIGLVSMVYTDAPDLTSGSGVIAELHFKLDAGVENLQLNTFETQMPHHSLTYYYNDYSTGRPEVKAVKPELNFALLGLPDGSAIPTSYALSQNFPNPFNPTTTISYSLPEAGDVEISVFNVLGQKVRVLVEGHQEAGEHEVMWDSKDTNGEQVASGVYFYRSQVNDFSETRKMVLLK